jgi:hypothetical protein
VSFTTSSVVAAGVPFHTSSSYTEDAAAVEAAAAGEFGTAVGADTIIGGDEGDEEDEEEEEENVPYSPNSLSDDRACIEGAGMSHREVSRAGIDGAYHEGEDEDDYYEVEGEGEGRGQGSGLWAAGGVIATLTGEGIENIQSALCSFGA